MWQSIAGGKLEQPPGVGLVARADDPRADALADQQRATTEESAEDDVAQHGLTRDHRPELLDRDDERAPC